MIPNLSITREQLIAFCDRWRVVELSVFGSVLRDDFRNDSDIDFLVVFADDAETTLFDLAQMEDEMAALVDRSVDIVPKRAVEQSRNPYRRDAILHAA